MMKQVNLSVIPPDMDEQEIINLLNWFVELGNHVLEREWLPDDEASELKQKIAEAREVFSRTNEEEE